MLGALAANLPLVIMPLFADQFANAHALADAGAAPVVEPAGLRAAILSPPPPPGARARAARRAAAAHSASSSSLSSARRRWSFAAPSRSSSRASVSATNSRTTAKTSPPRAVVRTSLARPSARIGDPLQVPVALEVLDQLRHRLLGHPGALGEVADARAVVVEVLEDVAVRVADLRVPALREPLDQLLGHRAKRLPQEDREVLGRARALVAAGVALTWTSFLPILT